MRKDKRDKYQLKASIHTVAVKSGEMLTEIPADIGRCITTSSRSKKDEIVTSSIINVNKMYGDLYLYSEFETALETVLVNSGIEKYELIRVDLR